MQKELFWGVAYEGQNSPFTSGGRGCVEAGPISPMNISRFGILKLKMLRIKNGMGKFHDFFRLEVK